MNTAIVITAIICITILMIVGIVMYVEYKLKNNDVLREIKNELKYVWNELDNNTRWTEIYAKHFEVIRNKLNELKNETNEL